MKNSLQLDVKDWQTNKYSNPELQIEELFRNYNVSTELIKRTTNQQELIDLILEEYIDRFDEIPGIDFVNVDELDFKIPVRSKLRSLILFASQAVLLKEKADLFREFEIANKKLQETTDKLDKKNAKLKEMNQQYLNMLGFVSHELRSPLISILGFAELMNERVLGSLNEEQGKAIKVIMRSSNSLIEMIQNYLDLAKIEQGEISLDKKPVDLCDDILMLVFEEMEEQFQKKELNICVESDQDTNSVECDIRLIRIVLNNLISNAVKYGENNGDLLVRFSHEKNHLETLVANTGLGLSQKELKKIFQKFSQGDGTRKRNYRSSGLGLYNSKYIVQKHGGKIWAESEFRKWFKVTFTLPFSK